MEKLVCPLGENSAVQKICDEKNPYLSSPEQDLLFVKAMREIFQWHVDHSEFYSLWAKKGNFSADNIQTLEDIPRIPSLLAHFFKVEELLSVPREQIVLHLTSSGTQGQKSQVFFDQWSIKSAQRMVAWIYDYYGWNQPQQKVNYLLFTYETTPTSRLGTAYTDNFLCEFAEANQTFYALKLTGEGGHEFDSQGVIKTLLEYERQGLPVRIFGFPAFLYFALTKMKNLGYPALRLHPESLVFTGGGWKSFGDQQVSKKDFYKVIEETLGIPNSRLRDGFGSTEHCVPYIECQNHEFHIPSWSRVYIRDFTDFRVLGYDQVGFIQFVSPYITSMPAHSVIMGDSGTLHPAQACGCGLQTDFFRKKGRAGVSKNKSCAVAAGELLKHQSMGGRP